jgi:hypothetical protein
LQVRVYAHVDIFALMTNTSFEASISLGMGAQDSLANEIQGGVKAKTEEENSWLLQKVKENEKVPLLFRSASGLACRPYRASQGYYSVLQRVP